MARLFADNADTTLASGINSSVTSITLTDAGDFPSPISPDYFIATITQAGATETSWEKVKVTARSGNVLTVVRGQEGSTAATWAGSDKFEIRWTAAEAFISANTAYSGNAILDFGDAPGGNYASSVVYGQTDIGSNSQCDAWVQIESSPDHNAYEHAIVPMTVRAGNINTTAKSFEIIGTSDIRLTGRWSVQWARTL